MDNASAAAVDAAQADSFSTPLALVERLQYFADLLAAVRGQQLDSWTVADLTNALGWARYVEAQTAAASAGQAPTEEALAATWASIVKAQQTGFGHRVRGACALRNARQTLLREILGNIRVSVPEAEASTTEGSTCGPIGNAADLLSVEHVLPHCVECGLDGAAELRRRTNLLARATQLQELSTIVAAGGGDAAERLSQRLGYPAQPGDVFSAAAGYVLLKRLALQAKTDRNGPVRDPDEKAHECAQTTDFDQIQSRLLALLDEFEPGQMVSSQPQLRQAVVSLLSALLCRIQHTYPSAESSDCAHNETMVCAAYQDNKKLVDALVAGLAKLLEVGMPTSDKTINASAEEVSGWAALDCRAVAGLCEGSQALTLSQLAALTSALAVPPRTRGDAERSPKSRRIHGTPAIHNHQTSVDPTMNMVQKGSDPATRLQALIELSPRLALLAAQLCRFI